MEQETKTKKYKRPCCPHCGKKMLFWEVPPFPYEDGLGWGCKYMYVCFNDSCSLYVEGWDSIKTHYGHNASYRCIKIPNEPEFSSMMVFTAQGLRGNIVEKIPSSDKSVVSIYGKTVFMNDGENTSNLSIKTYERELKQFHKKLAKKYKDKGQ